MGSVWDRPAVVGTLFIAVLGFMGNVVASAMQNGDPKVTLFERIFDNFYVVEPHRLYRSAQLSARNLCYYLKKFSIKTIINLRGKHKDAAWWQKEKMCAKKLGVNFFNIATSAVRPSTKSEISQLLGLYDHAPKPILIHCRGGADRTGEAAALWVLDQQKKSKYYALKHLSLKYRHMRSRCPFKSRLIHVWQGRAWLSQSYSPSSLAQ